MALSVFGIDFGTNNIKIYNGISKTITNEKNIIAIKNKTEVLAFGDEAFEMYEKNPDELQSSTRGKARIDYIYCTNKIYSSVKEAYTIRDDYVRTSSDHCPLVMEFKTPKAKKK